MPTYIRLLDRHKMSPYELGSKGMAGGGPGTWQDVPGHEGHDGWGPIEPEMWASTDLVAPELEDSEDLYDEADGPPDPRWRRGWRMPEQSPVYDAVDLRLSAYSVVRDRVLQHEVDTTNEKRLNHHNAHRVRAGKSTLRMLPRELSLVIINHEVVDLRPPPPPVQSKIKARARIKKAKVLKDRTVWPDEWRTPMATRVFAIGADFGGANAKHSTFFATLINGSGDFDYVEQPRRATLFTTEEAARLALSSLGSNDLRVIELKRKGVAWIEK